MTTLFVRRFGAHRVCFLETPFGFVAFKSSSLRNGRFLGGGIPTGALYPTLELALAREEAFWKEVDAL